MLRLQAVEAGYGSAQVLFGVSFAIEAGACVSLMGRNGMGKTTTVRTIMGQLPLRGGSIDRFGDAILLEDGNLNRAALRERVFAEPQERQWLEQLLHPLIREEIMTDLQSARSPYALLVSPLLVESGQNSLTKRIIVVDVPEAMHLARTVQRDAVPEAQVRAIMQAQAQREERLRHAHDVLTNDSDLAALHAQVDALHQRYLKLLESQA